MDQVFLKVSHFTGGEGDEQNHFVHIKFGERFSLIDLIYCVSCIIVMQKSNIKVSLNSCSNVFAFFCRHTHKTKLKTWIGFRKHFLSPSFLPQAAKRKTVSRHELCKPIM